MTRARAFAWAALALWVYVALLRQVVGPLNTDEVYFSHIVWLLNQGKRQYVDFYSNHLPVYFQLLKPLARALSPSPEDLSFVWGIRAVSAAIIAGYLAFAGAASRKALAGARAGFPETAALLLVFVVVGRMVEVRTDTVGLFLMNAAWLVLLTSGSTRASVVAAVLAGCAILFSARAAGMAGVLGLLLLSLAVRAREWKRVGALLLVAGSFVAGGVVVYLVAPEWVALVVRSCFLEPAKLSHPLTLAERFLTPERFLLSALVVGGLVAGIALLRRSRTERALVVVVACGAQLLAIVLDPSPYEYVYGWAAVPAVVGLASIGPLVALCAPAAVGAGLLAVSIGYTVLHGEPPRTASYFRLTPDAPIGAADIARLSTPDLVAMLISDERQKNLANQLRVRSEVCRRLPGTVLSTFGAHPICLDDALFHWTGVKWPALAEGDVPTPGALPADAFAQRFAGADRPVLYIWDHRWGPRRTLLPSTRRMLACCYELHEGFALARDARAR